MSKKPNKWLESLKVGDEVIESSGYGMTGCRRVRTITKITPTQVCIGDVRYRKDNGKRVGGSYSYGQPRLSEAAPQAVRDIQDAEEKSHLVHQIDTRTERNHLREMRLGDLQRIYKLLKQMEASTDFERKVEAGE